MYEAIVEAKILETTKKQIENLQKQSENVIQQVNTVANPIQSQSTIRIDSNTSSTII